MTSEPPYYILVSHSNVSNNIAASRAGPSSTSLGHPVIQYHYADDSPLSLLPKTPDEHVLILDSNDTYMNAIPTIKSISKNIALTGVKVSEAPGAAAAHDELKVKRNDKMYILETCTTMEEKTMESSQVDLQNGQIAVNQFKQRNAILRRALDYPKTPKGT